MSFAEAIARYGAKCEIVAEPDFAELEDRRMFDESIVVMENRSECINIRTGLTVKKDPIYYRFTLVLPVI